MRLKKLNSEELIGLLEILFAEYNLIAPFKVEQGRLNRVLYRKIRRETEIPAIYLKELPETTPKNFILPRDERLDFNDGEDNDSSDETRTRLFFGVRSCDLAAIELFDDVFLDEDYLDPFYEARRKSNIFIGYSNQILPPNNFQKELGIDYFDHQLAPAFLYEDIEARGRDHYYLKIKAGFEFPKVVENYLKELKTGEIEQLEALLSDWEAKFAQESEFEIKHKLPFPEKVAFNQVDWQEPTASCLGCGVCTYYCPTCFCFDFFWDGSTKNRAWDSCMFSLFTEHASGHNPREEQHQRWRQRLLHKFSYHPQNYGGKPGCVGCGRCIYKCPVNLDIRKVIKAVDNSLIEGGQASEER
ncbi:MAG: 4Fe-4S dicluster domain-containing protein [Halanaerobiaceae bacterium]